MKQILHRVSNFVGFQTAMLCTVAFLFMATTGVAQINLGLTATPNHSGGGSGAFAATAYNDAVIPPFGSQPWGWVTGSGWIEYTWTTPQNIGSVKLFMDNRPLISCTFEYWNGSAYVTIMPYVRPASAVETDSIVFPAPVLTTRIRMQTVAGSNPNFREIQMFQALNSYNDGGVSAVLSPGAFCPSTQPISVQIRNYGKNQIDSVYVNWQLNGVAQPGKWVVGLLDTVGGTGSTTDSVFLGNLAFAANTTTVLKAWTSQANNVLDTTNFNDTLVKSISPSIQGTYTVNSGIPTGGTNFANFVDLATFLSSNGVCGPVVVNVFPASAGYTGQAVFGNIVGASATNTITINGNGALLTSTGGTNNRATVTVDGTDYISFKNLIIEGTGTANSYGVVVSGNASFVTFDSCTVRVNTTLTVTTLIPFVASNTPASPTTAGTVPANNLTIKNSIIEGGYYGLLYNGPSAAPGGQNIVIENNSIKDVYAYTTYLRGLENSSVKNNDLTRATRSVISTFYGLYVTGPVSGTNFTGNKIHNTNDGSTTGSTNYCMYITTATATSANPATFSNNAIYNINNNSTIYGIYLLSGDYLRFYNNTVTVEDHATSPYTGTLRLFYATASTGNFDLKNNLFNLSANGPGTKHIMYISSTAPTYTINNNQYNLESATGTNAFGYYGTNVADFAAWKTINSGAFDQNGVYGSPIFSTTNVFTPQTSIGNAAGANVLAAVPTDIFGTARTTTPDIGAVEYVPLSCLQPLGFSGNSTSTAITLNWTNDPDADSVHIEYGPSGFNQGTGVGINATGSTFTANGLFSQTCYDFYVYTWCNGVAGNGTTMFTYCTKCGAKTVPFSENFDGTPVGTTTNPSLPECWSYYKSGVATNVYGYTYATGTPYSAPNHFRMYNANNTDDTLALISPAIAGLGLGDKRVRFWAKSAATTYNAPIIVGTVPSPDQMHLFTIMDTIVANSNYAEYIKTFNVATGYNGTDQYIVFMYGNLSTAQSVYIDNINFELVPQCAPPIGVTSSTITSSGATITWGSVSGNCFKLEYGPQGFTHSTGQGTKIQNATSPTSITGLLPNTFYDVYVFDCCDTLSPSTVYSFKTNCVAQLSGTYTIGGAPGANNFATIDSAITVLSGCGVSGPVTFNLAPGTFNATITLNTINGASATNTVTFNGTSPALATILIPAATTNGVKLDGTSYVTFKNLTIDGSNALRVIMLTNNANHITFEDCDLLHSLTTTLATTSVIAATSTETSVSSAGNNANDILVKNCLIRGSYYAVSFYGTSTTSRCSNIRIEGCEFDTPYFYAIRTYYVDNVEVINNTVTNFGATGGYGYYGTYTDNFKINGNYFNAKTYAVYLSQGNTSGTPAVKSEVINNMLIGSTYGLYFTTVNSYKMYHNSMVAASYGAYIASNTDVDIRNNIFNGATYAFYSSTAISGAVLNNNIYFATGANLAYWGAARATLAAWQIADPTLNVNSLSGDPLFVSGTDLHLIGGLANDVAAPGLATVDIDGDARPASGSTVADIGADEYTPVNHDIGLVSGNLERSKCMSTTDTVVFNIKNVIGATKNFATNPLTTVWNITGPVNSNGTLVTNTGTLAPNASMNIMQFTANLSLPGVYTLNAYLQTSTSNLLTLNDTMEPVVLTVYPAFEADPQTATVTNGTDSVEINIKSPFLGGGDFFITEVAHYKYTVGQPTNGWPAYLLADDYIEITGIPGSDLGGYTLEQWNTGLTGTMQTTNTFPAGTVLGPNGTAIIAVGQLGTSVPSPANFYYHGQGPIAVTFSSGGSNGRVLKNPNNVIVDAVGSAGTYIFPTASGVTTADWSTSVGIGNHTSTSGIRLEGPDLNGSAGWIVSNVSPQNPNAVNNLVQVPAPQSVSGFSWSLNGTLVDTNVNIHVGPWATPGVYNYVATLTNSPCGVLTDTVTITVAYTAACAAATNTSATATTCSGTTINWTSAATKLTSKIEYGPTGFTPGTGTVISGANSPQVITGLTLATGYSFRIVDSCAAGLSGAVVVNATTASGPVPTSAGSFSIVSVTGSGADVQFDASASTNYTSITWDFGDLSAPGTGVNPIHTYTANGTYTVTITVEGPCGTDVSTLQVVIAGIGIGEDGIFNALNIFPNPSKGMFNVSLVVEEATNVTIDVVSLQGQILISKNLGKIQGSHTEALELNNAAAGVYVIQITTDKGTVARRVTVNK